MAISLPIVTKYNDKGIKDAELSIGTFEGIALGIFAKIGASAVEAFARATQAAFDFGVDSIKAASSFQETSAAIGEVFGESSKQLQDFAESASSSIGQSRTQFLQGAKTFGIFGKAAGLAEADNANFATTLNSLASDMASFNDTSIDDAINALGAALRGESEPIRRYGVLLDDATLKARAMEMGIYDGTGSLTQQQRVLAAYEEVLAQTVTQQGDFTRTSDGLANSSRTLQSVFENLQISVGTALLPALEAVVPQLTAFIEEMVASPEFEQFIADLGTNFSNLLSFLPGALENLQSFGKDALPAVEAFFPALNEALGLMGAIFLGIGDSDPASATEDFATSMDTLAASLRGVADALKWLTTMWNGLPSWLKMSMPEVISFLATNPFTGTKTMWWQAVFGAQKPAMPAPAVPRGRLVGQANGGVTVRPGLSIIGEEGPEIMAMPRGAGVIPLDRIVGGDSKPSGNVFNINVTAGMGTDGAAVGEQIVNAIRRYERTSGAVFARA
jgi:hypothetical protein